MNTTSTSLIERLRRADGASPDWAFFHKIYAPFVRAHLARAGVPASDIDDLLNEVLVVVFRTLPVFERRRDGAFRAWLRTITVNQVRTWRRAAARRPAAGGPADQYLADLADPSTEAARLWDLEHDRHVFATLLAQIRADFDARTWEAFRLFALDGHPAAEVAGRLGVSENAVLLAKCRILKRLREEAAGLID